MTDRVLPGEPLQFRGSNSSNLVFSLHTYCFSISSSYFKIQYKVTETIELGYVWHHTIMRILNYDLKSAMGIKIKMGYIQQIVRFQFTVELN